MENSPQKILDFAVQVDRDHVLGPASAEMTLVEYGSYSCGRCHAVHEVVEGLRSRFGDRMKYVFRHLPLPGSGIAIRAAELAEYAGQIKSRFWEVHETLMEHGSELTDVDLEQIARDFDLFPTDSSNDSARAAAQAKVRQDIATAERGALKASPTFYINGRLYSGTWDESPLADAMVGHRIQAAAFEFVRWGPASGLLLGLATLFALLISNTSLGPAFAIFWETKFGFQFGGNGFQHSLLHWVNHGLLTVFFFVVGLEI